MNKLKQVLFETRILKIANFKPSVFDLLLIAGAIYAITVLKSTALLEILALLIAIVFHEVSHGYVANAFGDPTARNLGRLTLNPLPHVDPLGSIILPTLLILSGTGFIIGWAKPVPVNPRHFKNPFRDMMWVALAGPLTNLSIAFFSATIFNLMIAVALPKTALVLSIAYFLQYSILINIVLAVFNLIPIPPLDGSRILANFLSGNVLEGYMKLERYGFFIVMILAFTGVLGAILQILIPPILAIFL